MSTSTSSPSALEELVPFLSPSSRRDLTAVALQHVLGMTGDKDGARDIAGNDSAVRNLLELAADARAQAAKNEEEGDSGDKEAKVRSSFARDASLAIINLSSDPAAAAALLRSCPSLPARLWRLVESKESPVADPACMALSNLTVDRANCDAVAESLKEEGATLDKIVFVFCQEGYNSHGATLHYLGPLVSNLSQLKWARAAISDPTGCVLQRLLPFTEYSASRVRRGGVVGALRNCCFDEDRHPWLLGEEVDLLPRLLLPLAGPTPDDADPEEVEKLPVDLQYLAEDKAVEEDPDVRRMLLEALTQLCATRKGREALRGAGAYAVLKPLHEKEKDRAVRLACENLVDIVIKKEEEIGLDNYKEVEVPEDVVPQLEEMDKEYLEKE